MSFESQNFLVILSGVSGAGKNSLIEALIKKTGKFSNWVSYTTRPQRSNEIEGRDRYYISNEEFEKSIEKGEFVEFENVHGHFYGRKKKDFEQIVNAGKIPIMEVDVRGAQKFKRIFKNAVSFFIMPPSLEVALERLEKRGTESEKDIETRRQRYHMEMSQKDKYDYTIVNDELEKAQEELAEIIEREYSKRQNKNKTKKIVNNVVLFIALIVFLSAAALRAFSYFGQYPESDLFLGSEMAVTEQSQNSLTEGEATKEIESAPPTAEVKTEIVKDPPKHENPKSTSAIAKTQTNSDGSQTVVVSTGGVAIDAPAVPTITVNTPEDIIYNDETGENQALGTVLKNYLSSTLKWKNEISAMKQITLRDAGPTGWSGQYLGQYNLSSNGHDITSATGSIILNTYYYKSSPYFTDYMKLVLSHEYGHHYTLYHKWVDWDLGVSDRFPDSYYSTRPLSKTTTAVDYSLGWKNSEVEIMAEDYSYLFSGYGYHGMSQTYGYPSGAMVNWLNKIGDLSLLQNTSNSAPTVSITSPAAGNVLSGSVAFSADAGDDLLVTKVSFYINNTILAEDTTAPYSVDLNTTGFSNGSYTLKAIVSDGSLSAEQSIVVNFENSVVDLTAPTVSFTKPSENPYNWSSGDLNISVSADDDKAVAKVEIYVNGQLVFTNENDRFVATWTYDNGGPGEYELKAKVYDASGNTAEAIMAIVKK